MILRRLPFESAWFCEFPFDSVRFRSIPFDSVILRCLPFESAWLRSIPWASVWFRDLTLSSVWIRLILWTSVWLRSIPWASVWFCSIPRISVYPFDGYGTDFFRPQMGNYFPWAFSQLLIGFYQIDREVRRLLLNVDYSPMFYDLLIWFDDLFTRVINLDEEVFSLLAQGYGTGEIQSKDFIKFEYINVAFSGAWISKRVWVFDYSLQKEFDSWFVF